MKNKKSKEKYFLSTTGFGTIEECLKQIDDWYHAGTLKPNTLIIKAEEIWLPKLEKSYKLEPVEVTKEVAKHEKK